jgi:hypothetical protein
MSVLECSVFALNQGSTMEFWYMPIAFFFLISMSCTKTEISHVVRVRDAQGKPISSARLLWNGLELKNRDGEFSNTAPCPQKGVQLEITVPDTKRLFLPRVLDWNCRTTNLDVTLNEIPEAVIPKKSEPLIALHEDNLTSFQK